MTSGMLGCANPGIPRPPSLHVPQAVTDVAGARVGNRVELHWTAPSRTTDGADLTGPTVVEICRDHAAAEPTSLANRRTATPPATGIAVPCTPVLSIAGHSGASTTVTAIPAGPGITSGERPLFAYRIRILNSAGRSGPPSSPVYVPGGPVVPAVTGFSAKYSRAGVVLQWLKAQGESPSGEKPAWVEVERTIEPKPTTNGQVPMAPALARGSRVRAPDSVSRARRDNNVASIRLRQSPGDSAPPSSSPQSQFEGMVDQTAEQQESYSYQAQRIVTVSVGGKPYEIQSEPTDPLTVVTRITFPPVQPRGLVSIPSAIDLSTQGSKAHRAIDLAWEPNIETDLAGYVVYRVDLQAGMSNSAKPLRLTPDPVPSLNYRDDTVTSGHRYRYYVTAVDGGGNESTPSAPVEEGADGR